MLFLCLFISLYSVSAKLKSILYRCLFNHPWEHFMKPAMTLFLSAATHFLLLSICRLSNVVLFVSLCYILRWNESGRWARTLLLIFAAFTPKRASGIRPVFTNHVLSEQTRLLQLKPQLWASPCSGLYSGFTGFD